ncbi:hypothetical protein QBC45DRAFT_445202 [Copromyces sp. CBS 386.78]|nr:hypothetical protein QBC45DRAFT_445202 [Copromyces sp. CBS 386.78]
MSNPIGESGQTRPKKKLIINAFVEMSKLGSGHQSPGLLIALTFPSRTSHIIDLLLPELRKRGLSLLGRLYCSRRNISIYRENFYGAEGQKYPLDEHIASKYQWKAGVPAEEHKNSGVVGSGSGGVGLGRQKI